MTHVFTLNSTDFVPISFKDRYLFDTYDIITSYLKTKMSLDDLRRLLKPSLTQGGQIKWYGAFDTELARLSDLPQPIAEKIKGEFHKFLQKANSVASPLLSSRDADSREWGTLISELFQAEKIILIGSKDGQWAMLWGWDFRNREENRLPVISFPKEEVFENPPVTSSSDIPNNLHAKKQIFTEPIVSVKSEGGKMENEIRAAQTYKNNIGCVGRIVRWLRWVSYRFWALFWLLIYTLLIVWLTRYFSVPHCEECCDQLMRAKQDLEQLEVRIKERCDSTTYR